MRFGFLYENITYATKYLEIIPLPEIEDNYQYIKNNYWIDNGWLYPPIEYNGEQAVRPVQWYGLPISHELKMKIAASYELCQFIILFFGFIKGIQLRPEGCGDLYRTPFKKGILVAFHVSDNDIGPILDKAVEFYKSLEEKNIAKNYFAVIHWFLFGQSYRNDFEKFDSQYKVTDGCFNISKKLYNIENTYHSKRLHVMCSHFGIPTPSWANVELRGNKPFSKLSDIRNEFVH